MCFVDFEKAFDSVDRSISRKIMGEYGIPSKLIRMVKAIYEESNVLLRTVLEIKTGLMLKQG